MIKLNLANSLFINDEILENKKEKIKKIHDLIHNKTGLGNDFLGWVNLPINYDINELKEMEEVALNLQKKINYLVIVGIGGSYLGARAGIEMINGLYNNENKVKPIFLGNTISSTYTYQVLEFLKDKKFGICVISKSGTTTEPAIAFRLLQELLIEKVGKELAKYLIVCITDKSKGALKELATKKDYKTFIIPDDIGGRYSVLTPVGIFPMFVCGINVYNVLNGAKKAYEDLITIDNDAYRYAFSRYYLYSKYKYEAEMFISYEPQMQMINEWWKQLFGESEGKENKGLLPCSAIFSTDLHSLGQFIQEGRKKVLFETIVEIKIPNNDLKMINDDDNLDNLNYLKNKTLHQINTIAAKGVIEAHSNKGKVPNLLLEFSNMDDYMFGYLTYWFMKACAMSAYLLKINPFNQSGVEVYKKNMFKLLGKK